MSFAFSSLLPDVKRHPLLGRHHFHFFRPGEYSPARASPARQPRDERRTQSDDTSRPRPHVTSGTLPSRSLVGSRPGSPGDDGWGCGRPQLHGFGAAAAPGAAVPGVPSPHAGAGRAPGGGPGGRRRSDRTRPSILPGGHTRHRPSPAGSCDTSHRPTWSPHAPIRKWDVLSLPGMPGN